MIMGTRMTITTIITGTITIITLMSIISTSIRTSMRMTRTAIAAMRMCRPPRRSRANGRGGRPVRWPLPSASGRAAARLIVLFFAYPIGLYWAGVASTLVMALGTAITVSAIAAIAVYSKHFALRWAKKDDAWMSRLGFWLRLCGGSVDCRTGRAPVLGLAWDRQHDDVAWLHGAADGENRISSWAVLAGFIAICLAVGAAGGWITARSVAEWYPTIAKPSWTPPNSIFGPVWTALYHPDGLRRLARLAEGSRALPACAWR